jgi:hypothetical protein
MTADEYRGGGHAEALLSEPFEACWHLRCYLLLRTGAKEDS